MNDKLRFNIIYVRYRYSYYVYRYRIVLFFKVEGVLVACMYQLLVCLALFFSSYISPLSILNYKIVFIFLDTDFFYILRYTSYLDIQLEKYI